MQLQPSFATVADALNRCQPVVITVRFVPSVWVSPDAATTGIVTDTSLPHVSAHAVLAVGHSKISYSGMVDDALIVKNSWGQWGENGYGYIMRRYLDRHLICAHHVGSVA